MQNIYFKRKILLDLVFMALKILLIGISYPSLRNMCTIKVLYNLGIVIYI